MGIGTAIKNFIKKQIKKQTSKAASKAIAKTMADAGINKIGKDTSGVSKVVNMIRHPIKSIVSSLGIDKAIKNATDITGQLGIDDAVKAIEEPITPVTDIVKGVKKDDDIQYANAIRNLLKSLKVRVREGTSTETRSAMRASLDKIDQILDNAIDENGYKSTYIALKNWNGDFEGELIRLVAAIYDEEYNPKPHTKDNIGRGKFAYENALRSLAEKLEIDKDKIEGGFESLLMEFK